MNSPWQVNTLLAFVDRPLQRPPFVTGDVEIDDYLTRELDPSQRTTLAEHVGIQQIADAAAGRARLSVRLLRKAA